MIRDIKTYLAADSGLATLLNSNAGNTKLFPLVANNPAGETTPYILYSYSTDAFLDDIVSEAIVQLSIISENYDDAIAIAFKLDELLDVKDNVSFTSDRFHFYSSYKSGGNDAKESNTNLFNVTKLYTIKFKRKGAY